MTGAELPLFRAFAEQADAAARTASGLVASAAAGTLAAMTPALPEADAGAT